VSGVGIVTPALSRPFYQTHNCAQSRTNPSRPECAPPEGG
jgi:hypothetical protein